MTIASPMRFVADIVVFWVVQVVRVVHDLHGEVIATFFRWTTLDHPPKIRVVQGGPQ